MHISLSDYLMDIVQNSFEAGSIHVAVTIEQGLEKIVCTIEDDGKGMDAHQQRSVLDPFYSEAGKHDRRRVGLGLPFLHQAVEAAGGSFVLESALGEGTTVRFSFKSDHLDTPPTGDLALALATLLAHPLAQDLVIKRQWESDGKRGGYTLDRSELLEVLGEFESSGNLLLLRQFVASQESEVPSEVR